MSTEAEVIEFEGKRYRVAGKSGPGAEPKVGMVVRWDSRVFQRITAVDHEIEFHTGLRVNGHRQGGNWSTGAYEILAPLDASPPAETPRCEDWCGRSYYAAGVPANLGTDEPWIYPDKRCYVIAADGQPSFWRPKKGINDTAYCSPACADRARAAAAPKPAMGPPAVHMRCGKPHMPSEACPSPIPAGYRLADGWRTCGDAYGCRSNINDKSCSARARFTGPTLSGFRRGACLDCAERRGAIERVEALEDAARTMAKTARETADRIAVGILNDAFTRAYPPAPCLSHHPELGSRCEAPPGPHDMHIGRRPGTVERCEWWDALAPAETRAERWRRTHPGYGDAPSRKGADRDWDIRLFMVSKGMTANVPGSDFLAATNHKPAHWTPSDPEADIPWVWER